LDQLTKVCYKCQKSKALHKFSKDKTRKDGRQTQCKECRRAYYTANKNRALELVKQYRADNKEKIKAYQKEHRQGNAELYAAASARRRSRQRNATVPVFDDEHRLIRQLYLERDQLTKKTGIRHHVDHIIPLDRGGLHIYLNLQILTEEDNLTKGTKILIDGSYY